jgi:hypothetical protein
MRDVSRHKSMDVLQAYVRDADLFRRSSVLEASKPDDAKRPHRIDAGLQETAPYRSALANLSPELGAIMIYVFIDGNVWNWLFDRKLNLATELPKDEFRIVHTREAEFEIPENKPELNAFIAEAMGECEIKTDVYFGFAIEGLPSGEQRFGGFGVGRWATPEEIKFMGEQRRSPASRPTKLAKHEADISLAARALHSVVLTLDQRSAALKKAKAQGGKVVYLNDFDASGLSLSDFIKR